MESDFDFFRKIHTLENRFYEKHMTQEKGSLTEYDYFMLSIQARNALIQEGDNISSEFIVLADITIAESAVRLSEILSEIQVA